MKNRNAVLLALGLTAVVLASLFVILMPSQQAYVGQVARSDSTYNVTNGQSGFVFHGVAYTTTNGQVTLPDADYAYYSALVDAGVLKNAAAPSGGTVFLNSSQMVAGSGASVDLQSGSLVTMSTTIAGNPTFSGNVAVGGKVDVGGGYGNTGCTFSTAGVLQCNGAGTFGGALGAASLTGALTGNVTGNVTGNLTGNVTGNVSGTLTSGGVAFAVSDPLTITGVLTNVRVLYYQVP